MNPMEKPRLVDAPAVRGGGPGGLTTLVGRRIFIAILAASAVVLLFPRQLLDRFRGVGGSPGTGFINAVISNLAPVGRFRIYSVTELPVVDRAHWTLRLDGMVRSPTTLNHAQVMALPMDSQVSDFHCVTGWQVDGVHWRGVRIQTLIDLVTPLAGATHCTLYSFDGAYVDNLSLGTLLLPDTMLAVMMDGMPLPDEQGAPMRLVVPRMFGYKSVKWVNRIEFTSEAVTGYWEQRGYSPDAWIDAAPPGVDQIQEHFPTQ
ncbi:MAG: molybdopterin-dependent oxidoreductase [Candidatus Dormibacteria bacterium]